MKNGFFYRNFGINFLALFLFSAAVATAAQSTLKTIPGSVPAEVAALGLAPVDDLPPTSVLNLAISLPVRDQGGLDLLQQQIYDPSSPNYHKYLTPAEFTEQFGATEADCQAVAAFAQAHGLTVTSTHPNRLVLDVSGTVADIEAAFHVELKVYNHPTEPRNFFAPVTEPVVSASLPILHISGLENYYLPQSQIRSKPNGVSPQGGSAPGGGFSAADLRKAYVPGTILTGAGQSVGLLQFDGFFASDITTYASVNNIKSPPIVQTIPIDGGVSSPSFGNVEVAMDIEMIMALAPGVSTIYVYEAPNPSPWVDLLSRMANDNLAKQLSCSWGGGPTNAAAEQIFQQMAVQGQSFFNASGDTAAFIPVKNPPTFPSESPHITQVGGTVLTTSSSRVYSSETVWNTPTIPRQGTYQGSSGGISVNYPIPSWQANISMAKNHGSTTKRNIPDVALIADNIWIAYDNGVTGPDGGGTSSAAPLWAAFTALVNQQATINGNAPMGFINPALYTIATNAASYTNCFHDITTGANTNSLSPTNFPAVSGFDLCTGLGTPNGSALIYALAGRAPATGFLQLTVNPGTGSTLLNSTNQKVSVTVNDGGYDITNAKVTLSIPGVATNLSLVNASQPPGADYTNTFPVPAVPVSSLTMTIAATATNEIGATNVIYYSVVPLPANDNFANATKVPAAGGSYNANNYYATIETNEPAHNGDSNDAGSLWWQWTPTANTGVFIDTIGSKVENVLAVYTNASLPTLGQVAATNSNLAQFQPAYVSFNAQAGVTYRIAVASVSSNALGSLVLQVTPGGQLDTNPPGVFVTSPLNGQTVTNQSLLISGTAVDPGPNASGVSQITVTVNGSPTTATGTTNWTAPAALQPSLNIIQVTAVDAAGNVSSPVTVQVNYLVPTVGNDFFVNATRLTNTSGVVTADTSTATKELGEPDIAGNPGGKSVWWSFTAPGDGVLTLNTTNSPFDTLLGLFTGTNVATLTTISANDDAYPGSLNGFSFINQAVRSNVNYSIDVDGYDGVSGTVSLNYSFVASTNYNLSVNSGAGGSVQVTTINSLGGTATMAGQSGYFAAGTLVTLSATPGLSSQFANWSGSVASTANPLTVVITSNLTVTANFTPLPFTDGFESGGLSHLTWSSSGNVPWFVQTNVVDQGQYAARSGVIPDNANSVLTLTTNFTAGNGSFDYKVSSEANWDILSFSVDGVLYQQWSGEAGWANYAFYLSSGLHTLQWTYTKDSSGNSGLDAAFVDDLILPIGVPAPPVPPQLTSGFNAASGTFQLAVAGTASQSVIVQVSSNLVSWSSVATNVIPFTNSFSATNFPMLFYRAVTGP